MRLLSNAGTDRVLDCLRGAQARVTARALTQSVLLAGQTCVTGDCAFTTAGPGLTPADQHGLAQVGTDPAEAAALAQWFTGLWDQAAPDGAAPLLAALDNMARPQAPSLDSAFADDVAKVNCAAILVQHGFPEANLKSP
ncbi:MAG: hypothetical protein ACRD1Y_14105 [Terriglobales bacterium]